MTKQKQLILKDIPKLVLEEDRKIVINDFIDLVNGRILYYQCRLKLNFNGIENRWFLIRGMCLRDTGVLQLKL